MIMLKQGKAGRLHNAGVFTMKQMFWQPLKFKRSLDTSKTWQKAAVYDHNILNIL